MGKLRLIIKREYLAKVRNRSFVVMTFLSPILMVGLVVLVAYLAQLNDGEKRIIAILNESDYFSTDFHTTESTSYVRLFDLDIETAKDSTEKMGYTGLLHIPQKKTLEAVAEASYFFSKNTPNTLVLEKIEAVFEERLRQRRLQEMGVSPKDYAMVDSRYEVNIATFSGEQNLKHFNEIKAAIGGAFGYLIMMFIIIYGGFVMRSVIEEKTSRIIEVIISSVKPFQLMLGKIIGTSLAGITQFTIWIVSASILLLLALALLDMDLATLRTGPVMIADATGQLPTAMPATNEMFALYAQEIFKIPIFTLVGFFLVYFVLGYLIYSSIYAAIGAAVDNETDTQQFIFPIIIPLVLAIYVGFFSVFNNPHGPIAVGFSIFPLTSPIVMMMRLPWGIGEGGVPIWQLVISILLLIGTFMGIVWFAAKIYRVGILMYGKKPSYKELFKWLRY